MATAEKRNLPAKVQAMKARKRQKIAHDSFNPTSSKNAAKRATATDALSWKAIETPDLLDDYEGFFGLEEVEGVEVIKDAASGAVSYLPTAAGTKSSSLPAQDLENAADDWSGFEEEQSAVIPIKQVKQDRVANGLNDTKSTKSDRKTKQKPFKTDSAFDKLSSFDDGSDLDVSAWSSLKLAPDTMAALRRMKFSKPTAIQKASIPAILKGHDVIGKASTGSGKTLAYGIPILERFLELESAARSDKTPLALILSPTRELAHQIHKHLVALSSDILNSSPSIVTVTGGLSLHKQQRLLATADVVIGTPGRLWELISSQTSFAKAIRQIHFLVVDEADRLLSEGHFKEVAEVLNALDRKDDPLDMENESTAQEETKKLDRQSLVFSATFDKGLQKKLSGKTRYGSDLMSNKESMEYLLTKIKFKDEQPKFIDVDPVSQMATGLKEGLVECGAMEKDLYLYATLLHNRNLRTLVFTNSIAAVRRIAPFLENLGLPALALHSGMIQKARLRSIERFTQSGKGGSILVATDVAARGLDIPNVQLVIHYHLPRAADVYVHRSGRTARAGQEGSSILICSPEEVAGVRRLVAKVHAQSASKQNVSEAARQGYYIRTLDPDRKVVARLKPRATLAKKLADVSIAKEKVHKEDDFLRSAAEELGVDYDSDEFDKQSRGKRARGSGRKQKERVASTVPKAEVSSMRAELKELLKERINVGVSETYLTAGRVDIDELLRQQEVGSKTGEFLGSHGGFGLDDEKE